MLRIESYITPIILSYVDKYIKNLKAEDSQVSLWGGDAVFNNLDLRLDVLEQELSLPFSFVNGHIHELRIHVPWTKLTSEPIVITINTIECILKLKGSSASGESEASSQSGSSISKSQETRRRQKRQDLEVPTSYVQGLINKIINNVSIVCNNFILKYVEDDIVLSINVKTLEFKSVDQFWSSAFNDLSAENLILRNLVSLTDLTICLDKRNASGKIENYQEPLLYRCSLTCRIVRLFESVYSLQPITVRYDIFCPQLHFSLSDTQLPMFLRLLELALALYYGHLSELSSHVLPEGDTNKKEEPDLKMEGNPDADSWSSWAWNIGSSLVPIYWEEEEEGVLSNHQHKLKRILHMGIYVDIATWVFKLTESLQESDFPGPSKKKFTPFLKIEQQGSFMTVVVKGIEVVNVQMGISDFAVDPIGICICGIPDAENNHGRSSDNVLLSKYGYIRSGRESREYLSMSLFDDEVLLSARELWSYNYIWDKHLLTATESTMLDKSAAFVLDYLYMMEIPNVSDVSSEKLSEISANPELCDFKEKASCRAVFGPAEINISSGYYHRCVAIQLALDQYDYQPYYSNKPETLMHFEEILDEEMRELEANSPVRLYSLSAFECTLLFHTAQHPNIDVKSVLIEKSRKRHQKASGELCMARILPVPAIILKISKFDLTYYRAMYPERLVSIASVMRPPSATLLQNCHSHLSVKLHNTSFGLQNEEGLSIFIVEDFSPSFYCKSLMLPHLWTSLCQPQKEYFVEFDNIVIAASMPHVMLLQFIISSWGMDLPTPEDLITNSLLNDAVKIVERHCLIVAKFTAFKAKFCDTQSLYATMVSLTSVSATLSKSNHEIICFFISGPENATNKDLLSENSSPEKLIKFTMQIPKQIDNDSIPAIFTCKCLKTSFLFDPQIANLLKYSPRTVDKNMYAENIAFRKISEIRPLNKGRKSSEADGKSSKYESSSISRSETWTGSKINHLINQQITVGEAPKKWKEYFVSIYPLINNLLVYVEIDVMSLFLPTVSLSVNTECDLINAVHRIYLTRSEKSNIGDTTVIYMPRVLLQNSSQKQILPNYINDVPIILPSEAWTSDKDKLPWSLSLSNFNVYSLQGSGHSVKLPVLKPVNTTATLALVTKYQGPVLNQVGIVIHMDMSPLDFCGCRRQVEGHIAITENILSLVAFFLEKRKNSKISPSCASTATKGSSKQSIHPSKQTSSSVSQNLKKIFQKGLNDETISKSHEKVPVAESQNLPEKPLITAPSVSDPHTTTAHVTEAEDVGENQDKKSTLPPEQGESCAESIIVTTWVQWTVARVSASLYSQNRVETRKLVGELEDLTLSLDIHHVYSKFKCKMANASLLHYIKSQTGWLAGEFEGVILTGGEKIPKDIKIVNPQTGLSESYQSTEVDVAHHEQPKSHGFLSITLTTALCQNVHTKWNQMVRRHLSDDRFIKERISPSYLSEVDLRIQPFDIICFPSALEIFTSVYEPWLLLQLPKEFMKSATKTPTSVPLGLNINNKVLPLVYLQIEGIRLFFPAPPQFPPDLNNHNVILVQVGSILVSPQVDNPLSRIILRPDVYYAAEQARILGIPGAEIEDRQYQIDFLGSSMSTGAWDDVSKLKQRRPGSLSSEILGVRGENPALEWNNYDPTMNIDEPEVIFHPIVTKMDTKIIVAPAVIYLNSEKAFNYEDALLVAGHSLEVNATSDISIYASLSQIMLLRAVLEENLRLITNLKGFGLLKKNSSLSSEILDSGVDCDISSLDMSKTGLNDLDKASDSLSSFEFVPVEVLVTGSRITANIFEKCIIESQKVSLKTCQRSKLEQRARSREKKMALEVASTESEPSPLKSRPNGESIPSLNRKKNKITDVEDGYEGSEEESLYEPIGICEAHPRLLPLIYVSVSQPHTFLRCQPSEQKLDVSCFDFVARSVPKDFSIKGSDTNKLPKAEDYTTSWIETKPGDPDPKSGIPPALLTLSAFDFIHKPAKIHINVGRPVRINIGKNKWDQVIHVQKKFAKLFPVKCEDINVRFDRKLSPPSQPDEFSFTESLRGNMSNLEHISFATNQIVVNLETSSTNKLKSELHCSVSGISTSVLTVRRKSNPDKTDSLSDITLQGDVKDLQIKTVYCSLQQHSLLKPWNIGGEVKLQWLNWLPHPTLELKLMSEILEFTIGPENILALFDLQQSAMSFMSQFFPKDERIPHNYKIIPQEEKFPDLYFQDDLRAGVFQYVHFPKVTLSDIFPQPYQVIFDKPSGIMVWCYPEPRALIRVDIYPVPFVAVSEASSAISDSSNQEVTCVLQYYDALCEAFITYQKFQLSESQICKLDLPGLCEKRYIAISTTWRVCIDFETEEEPAMSSVSVSPETLAACMRIDSLFSTDILPRAQAVVTFRKLDVAVANHMMLTGSKLSFPLSSYEFDQRMPNNQVFLTSSLNNLCLRAYSWPSYKHVEASCSLSVSILNYKFLTYTELVEAPNIKISATNQQENNKQKPNFSDFQIRINSMFLHLNQSTVKTLYSSNECWQQAFFFSSQLKETSINTLKQLNPAICMTNYILCNNSTQYVRFGQVDTDENIFLRPGHLHFYCWRSHKVSPRLQFCIESSRWKWSEPVELDSEGNQIFAINVANEHSYKFLINCKKLFSCQMQVTFDGLLSVANALNDELELRIIDKAANEDSPKHPSVYALESRSKSLSYIGDPQGIRIRFHKTSTMWSGEVPLSTDSVKESLLIKVPLKSKGDCVTVICRIWKQRVGTAWRVLILLASQLVFRSHLPRPLTLHLFTPSSKSSQKITVKGRSHQHPLFCDASMTHQLTLQLSPELEVSKPPISLTTTMYEQVRESGIQEVFDLSEFMNNLFVDSGDKWPYIDSPYMDGDFLFADQPKIDLQVGFSCLYPNCNSLVVDIRPWALIVNHTGSEILLKEGETMENVWYIPSGAVFAPPKLENFFTFGIVEEGEQAFCHTLQLSKEERWYTLKFEGSLPREGETNVQIRLKDKLCFLSILTRYKENIQILHLLPTFSISNNTDESFEIRPMYVYTSEDRIDLQEATSVLELSAKHKPDIKEVALVFWEQFGDLSFASHEGAYCFQILRHGYTSQPITVQDVGSDCRVNFTLPKRDADDILNDAFIITVHPNNNQVKFVIQKDSSPQMVIHNNTVSLLVIGQSSLKEEGLMEEEMDIFSSVPSVPPTKSVFYTFPHISRSFPDISNSSEQYPRLHLSQPDILDIADTEEVLWSQGIDIHHHFDQFVAIPGFGDAKIHIEKTGHIVHVFIDSASRIEISANDIRSRINTLPSKGRVATPSNKGRVALLHREENITDLDKCSVGHLPSARSELKDRKSTKPSPVIYGTLLCSELVFVLKDDLSSNKFISEVMRITLESFIITFRPKIDLSERLRALNYQSKNKLEVVIIIEDAQIDNQLYPSGNYDFPVIVIRQDKKTCLKFSALDPLERIIQSSYNNSLCSVSLLLESYNQVTSVNSFYLKVNPLNVFIEDAFIYSLMRFMKSFPVGFSSTSLPVAREEEDCEKTLLVLKLPNEILCKSEAMTNPIRMHKLSIEPISLLLSFHAAVKMYIAFDKTPLHFQSYQRTDIITTGYALGYNIAMHYLSSVFFKAGWVVSSLDLLGNPGGFARTVGSGIRDFVQLPYEGILHGPWAFVGGITHGSLSLMKHLTAGTLVSVTNLASSVARNMERLSMDQDHVLRSELYRRSKPSNLAYGVAQGLSSFGISLLGAAGGVFHQPMQAVMNDGISTSSIVGGFSKGLVGIVAKPIGGAADFFVHTGHGLLQGAGWKQDRQRKFEAEKISYSSVANSPLKITWKLLAALPTECRQVISSAEAMLVTSSGSLSPVTVLLTPQVVFILGIEEDAQQHAFPLDELTWRSHPNDPTLLYLEKTKPQLKVVNDDAEPISGCPERVADYVRSTCSEGFDIGNISSDEDSSRAISPKDPLSRVKLFISEQYKSFLISSINISVRANKGQGFIS